MGVRCRTKHRNASAFLGLCGAVLMVAVAAGCGSGGSGGVAPPPPSGSSKLYVASGFPGAVSGYSIDPSTGLLADLAGFPVATFPSTLLAFPTSMNVAVGNVGSKQFSYVTTFLDQCLISEYAIDSSGMFAGLADSPFLPNNDCPADLVVDPTGKYLYATGPENDDILEFNIDQTTGDLTPMPSSPLFPDGCEPLRITEDPSGQFVYTTATNCGGDIIQEFAVDSTGATCGSPGCLVFIGAQAEYDPANSSNFLSTLAGITSASVGGSEFVYVTDIGLSPNIVAEYSVETNGTGTTDCSSGSSNGGTTNPAGCLNVMGYTNGFGTPLSDPTDITVDPSSQFAYVANHTPRNIAMFSVVGTGTVGTGCDSSNIDTGLGCLNNIGRELVPNVDSSNPSTPLRVVATKTSGGGEYLYSTDDTGENVLEYVINLTGSANCNSLAPIIVHANQSNVAVLTQTYSGPGCLSINGPGALPISGVITGPIPHFLLGGMAIAQ